MNERCVHLTPRLLCALSMLKGSQTVVDIGCDHGRLTAALLQQHICECVIATDISKPSLEKAKQLLSYIGLADHVSFRHGDGLEVLNNDEFDSIAMLGMGGTLMQQILSRHAEILTDHVKLVLQPMRAQADIREYLYRNNYWITDDRIICERDRYYQIFRAVHKHLPQPWPKDFPINFFEVGYQSFRYCDSNLLSYCELQNGILKKQFMTACGSDGEKKLRSRIDSYEQIIGYLSRKLS